MAAMADDKTTKYDRQLRYMSVLAPSLSLSVGT
jgi:hypothetical protein